MDYRSLGNEVVTLVVGAEKKVFTVHKKLLCDRSAFFSKGFNGQFKEAAEGRMELPNDTSAAFECFLTWLYWDKTPPLPARLSSAACDGNLAFPISPTAEDIRSFVMTMLYPAYVLAEKFCLHDMQNRFMNAIQDVHAQVCTLPDAKEIQFIYENTQENSKLRLYCATAVAYSLARCADLGQVKDFANLCATIPDFALDLLQVCIFFDFSIQISYQFCGVCKLFFSRMLTPRYFRFTKPKGISFTTSTIPAIPVSDPSSTTKL